MRKLLYAFLSGITLLSLAAALSGTTFAAVTNPNHGYFNPANGPETTGFGQVITCGFTAASAGCPGIDPAGGACGILQPGMTTKSTFEAFIQNTINAGGRNATGAEFIVQLMRPDASGATPHTRPTAADISDWENRINQPAVTIRCNDNVDYGGWNSGYMKGIGADDDAFFAEPGSASALEFDYNGAPEFYLKVICANPIGSMVGLPPLTTVGNINGFKVDTTGATAPAPASTASVSISGPTSGSATSNPFYFNGISTGSYTVTAANATGYTVVGSTWCDSVSTCSPGGVGGTNYHAGSSTTVTVTNGSSVQMRWIYQAASGGGGGGGGGGSPVACPEQPGVDFTHVPATFPTAPDSDIPPNPPKKGDTYTTRTVTSTTITAATDHYTGQALGHDATTVNFTNSISDFPYDSQQADVAYMDSYTIRIYTYNGTSWQLTNTGNTSATYAGSASLGECYYRTFSVQPSGGGTATFDNSEDPSTASIVDPITVTFGYDGPTPHVVRNPMIVNGINLGPSQLLVEHSPSGVNTYPYPNATASNYPSSYTGSVSASATFKATIPALRYGDSLCYVLTASVGAADVDQSGNIQQPTTAGSNSDPNVTCSAPLAQKPYVRVFGGEVEVGGGVGTAISCPSNVSAGISTWNQGAPSYAGSGAQYDVGVLGIIDGFASDIGNANANPGAGPPPTGLTFANTTGAYGGSFQSVPPCSPDYTTGMPGGAPTSLDVPPTTLTNGTHITQYAKGDVFISGNIVYAANGTTWTQLSDIPTYKLIVVGGDIYISTNVTELDGLYVAEPNAAGTGGTIYTCATAASTVVPTSQLFDSCNTPLVINGSFVAKQVQLLRTNGNQGGSQNGGSDYLSTTDEQPVPCLTTLPKVPNRCSASAEIFNYTPEMWLAEPPSNLNTRYDSITSLPPVL